MGVSEIRRKTVYGLRAGDVFEVKRTFVESDVRRFAGLTRDYNPVHFDKRFSSAKGFDDRISHGLLTASMLTEIGGQIGWLATRMDFHFLKPVYFGDTVICRLTLSRVDARNRAEAEAVFTNQNGETVLKGLLAGILPNENERGILASMIAEGDPTNDIVNR